MVSRRVIGLAIAGACGLGAVLLPAATPVAQGPCAGKSERSGDTGTWSSIRAPNFPAGNQGIVAHAVDPATKDWYVTNGRVIMASGDVGCTFETVYELDGNVAGAARIDALSATGGVVAANVAAPSPDGSKPAAAASAVTVSQDGGKSFGDLVPLAGAGTPGPIEIAPLNPGLIYATAGKVLHRSTDGGQNFEPVPGAAVADPATVGQPELAIDAFNEERAYVRTDSGLIRTADGGETWNKAVDDELAGGPAVAPSLDGHLGHVVAVTPDQEGDAGGYLVSDDGGATFKPKSEAEYGEMEGKVISTTGGGLFTEDVIITTEGRQGGPDPGVYRWYPQTGRFGQYDEMAFGPMEGATTDRLGCTSYFFRDEKLFTWDLPAGPDGCTLPPPPVLKRLPFEYFEPPPPPKPREAKLKPGDGDITIPVGGSTTVKYTLDLPAQPTRLDTFFLMDTSNSTDPYIDGLKIGVGRLIRELLRGFTDANFGLGEYQDTGFQGDSVQEDDDSQTQDGISCVRYRRRADITPPDKRFQEALDKIVTCGGSEPGWTGVHQVATGSGILEPPFGRKVNPDRGAHWRDETMRVLFHVADEPFSRDPGSPPPAETIKALKERNIKFIGFDMSCSISLGVGATVGGTSTSPECPEQSSVLGPAPDCTKFPAPSSEADRTTSTGGLYCELWEMAMETQTFAPRGGVDCNGDKKADVREGEPMVCRITGDSSSGFIEMADPVREMLLALPDLQKAELLEESRAQIGVAIKPLSELEVDVHGDHDLEFEVTLSCTEAQRQKAFPVRFVARLKGKAVARAKARAICGALPAPPALPAASQPLDPPKKAKKPADAPLPSKPQPPAPVAPAPVIAPPGFAIAAAPAPPPAPAQGLAPANAPAQAAASAPGTAPAPATAPGVAAAAIAPAPQQAQVQTIRHDPTSHRDESSGKFTGNNELHFSAPDDGLGSGAPGDPAWMVRLLGTTAVLGAAFAMMPRRRREQRARRAHIR